MTSILIFVAATALLLLLARYGNNRLKAERLKGIASIIRAEQASEARERSSATYRYGQREDSVQKAIAALRQGA